MKEVYYLQSYIILKDNSIKECILKMVRVNSGYSGSVANKGLFWQEKEGLKSRKMMV